MFLYYCWCIFRIISPFWGCSNSAPWHHSSSSISRNQIMWLRKPNKTMPDSYNGSHVGFKASSINQTDQSPVTNSITTFSKAQWPSISQLILYDISIEWDKRSNPSAEDKYSHPASITTIGTFHLMWGPFLGYWIIYRFVSGLLKHVWACPF